MLAMPRPNFVKALSSSANTAKTELAKMNATVPKIKIDLLIAGSFSFISLDSIRSGIPEESCPSGLSANTLKIEQRYHDAQKIKPNVWSFCF